MPSNLQTPVVYIEEKNAFPNSAVAVETAVSVFIGYTEKAEFKGSDLLKKPVRISSFAEYVERFGTGFVSKFSLNKLDSDVKKDDENIILIGEQHYQISANADTVVHMYNSLRLFYAN